MKCLFSQFFSIIFFQVNFTNGDTRFGVKIEISKIIYSNNKNAIGTHGVCENPEKTECTKTLIKPILQISQNIFDIPEVSKKSTLVEKIYKLYTICKKNICSKKSFGIYFVDDGYIVQQLQDFSKFMIDYYLISPNLNLFHDLCDNCKTLNNYVSFKSNIKLHMGSVNFNFRSLIFKIFKLKVDPNKTSPECENSVETISGTQKIFFKSNSKKGKINYSDLFDLKCHYLFQLKIATRNFFSDEKIFPLYFQDGVKHFINLFREEIFGPPKNYSLRISYEDSTEKTFRNSVFNDIWDLSIGLHPYEAIEISDSNSKKNIFTASFKLYFVSYGYEGVNAEITSTHASKAYSPDRTDPDKSSKMCVENSKCQNNGQCFGTSSNYRCVCPPEIDAYGIHCENPVCRSTKCPNSKCIAPNKCGGQCNPGWDGPQCDQPSFREYNICPEKAEKTIVDGKRICKCPEKYIGEFCQFRCPKICVNGECAIKNGAPFCICFKGFYGRTCEDIYFAKQTTNKSSHTFIFSTILILLIWTGAIACTTSWQLNKFKAMNITGSLTEHDLKRVIEGQQNSTLCQSLLKDKHTVQTEFLTRNDDCESEGQSKKKSTIIAFGNNLKNLQEDDNPYDEQQAENPKSEEYVINPPQEKESSYDLEADDHHN